MELGTAWWEENSRDGLIRGSGPVACKGESNRSGLEGHIKGKSSRTDVRALTRSAALVAVTEEMRVDLTLAM